MNNEEIKLRVQEVMAGVFGVERSSLRDDSSPDTVEGWDSVGQLNLIMGLEQEFGISFTDEQSVELRSLELAACVVAEALAKKGA